MKEIVTYANNEAEVTDASGVSGVLTKGADGNYFFRLYYHDKTFTDFDLNHDDLPVTIDQDALASFYKFGDHNVLDHSPQVLGLKTLT